MILDSLRTVIYSTIQHSKSTYFLHPYLSEEEIKSGFRLSLDSWADTGCSVKHDYVDYFFKGKGVNVTGFVSNLGSIDNFLISHVLYVFYK